MERFTGWIIVVLNIAAAFYTLGYFISSYQLTFIELALLNAGLFSIVILSVGFYIKNQLLMSISVPFLSAYGFLGLFTSSWSQGIPSEQFGNLLMTIAIIYVIYSTIHKKSYVEFTLGIVIGMFLLIPFNKMQMDYLGGRPDILKKSNQNKAENTFTIETATQELSVEMTWESISE